MRVLPSGQSIPDSLVAKPGIWAMDYRGEEEKWSGLYLIFDRGIRRAGKEIPLVGRQDVFLGSGWQWYVWLDLLRALVYSG